MMLGMMSAAFLSISRFAYLAQNTEELGLYFYQTAGFVFVNEIDYFANLAFVDDGPPKTESCSLNYSLMNKSIPSLVHIFRDQSSFIISFRNITAKTFPHYHDYKHHIIKNKLYENPAQTIEQDVTYHYIAMVGLSIYFQECFLEYINSFSFITSASA